MRKYILLFLLTCLHIVARGQTPEGVDLSVLPQPTKAEKLQYWFDDDIGSLSSMQQVGGKQTIDVSSLPTGMHIIHYQIVDNKGKVAVPYSAMFMKLAQYNLETASGLQYWFDDDEKSVKKTNLQNGVSTIDVSAINEGLHTLHYQILDSHDMPSYIASAFFMKTGKSLGDETLRAERLMYWYDDEEKIVQADLNAGMNMLDASHLTEGLHTLHYQVLCNNGALTEARSAFFFRVNYDANSAKAKEMRYWYDDQTTARTTEIKEGVQMLDVSDLVAGLHIVHYQLVDESGKLGVPASTMFFKVDAMPELAQAKTQRYWFDDDHEDMHECAVTNGVQSLDVKGLSTGMHTLHYQLVDGAGNVTVPYSGIFMKMSEFESADGKNAIIRYRYWLNDGSDMKTVELQKPSNPFQLISLLPMQKTPIRSSAFHFETKSGEPMIYAKNDFHIRFEDAAGYWSDDARSFVDYSVSEKVTDIAELKSTQTFNRLDNNVIKWFKFDAAPGDTIAFKSSQATSVQVFAPSGNEIFSASGDKSVVYGGTHTWEAGTYYVAVHDVTGSKPSITLDYMHMDKYDLVSTSEPTFGVIPCVQALKMVGNGFNYLKNVRIRKGDIVIAADTIEVLDKSVSFAYFTFSGKEQLGVYDLVLDFDDNVDHRSVIREQYLTLDTPTFEDIIVRVERNSNFQNPVTLKITVTNPNNVSYSFVPFNIAWDKIDVTSKLLFKNFWISMPEESDSLGYSNISLTDNLLGKGVKGGVIQSYIPRLNAHESKNYIIDFTFEKFPVTSNVYAWTGTPYELGKISAAKSNRRRTYDAEGARNLLAATDLAEGITGMEGLPQNVGMAGQVANNAAKIGVALAGISEGIDHSVDMTILSMSDIETWDPSTAEMIRGLHGKGLLSPGEIIGGRLGEFVDELLGVQNRCAEQPNPIPTGQGSAQRVASIDPNDIFGYTSDSGSRYINDDVVTLPYRIEFENDTTFATASAHTVIVKDTLDASKFDLASYKPTIIKIGDKDVQLNGDKTFVTTVDMRPAINTIAQVEGLYDEKKGIATWKFTSLDPMTMEETDDVMQGFLPVNFDGSGIGEVAFNIDRLANLADGTEIDNKASIVFDSNDAIETPVWTNIIDAIPPVSEVSNVEQMNDSIVRVHLDGYDNRSGIWKYALYVQYGKNTSWNQVCETDTTCFDFRFSDDIDYGFCVLATDSAGNVEKKIIQREYSFLNGNGIVTESISPSRETEVTINKAYDLSGRLIQEEGYRGIIIKNRKKLLKR